MSGAVAGEVGWGQTLKDFEHLAEIIGLYPAGPGGPLKVLNRSSNMTSSVSEKDSAPAASTANAKLLLMDKLRRLGRLNAAPRGPPLSSPHIPTGRLALRTGF